MSLVSGWCCWFALLPPLVFFGSQVLPAFTPVKVWEDALTIPTYEEGPPLEEPQMRVFAPNNVVYPYTMRARFLNRAKPEAWRAVHLENEFLACTVLPDLGGHLYRCIDKADGHDVFHPALSLKKQYIGQRGAWVSTGVEFNFPLGHSMVSISPVDYHWAEGFDGSASVWVGDRDRVEDLNWLVRITLRPGSRTIEQEVTLYNPGVQRRRYYWWANAAVTKESKDLRYVLPTYLISEDATPGKAAAWPVNASGVDRSVSSNITEMFGVFAYLSRESFLGVYNPASKTGLVHWAKFEDLPGKKLWDWGSVADVEMREKLSDNGSTYVEIQAGSVLTNAEFALLMPQETKHFMEYWIPVHGMPAIVRATQDLVLGLERKGSTVGVYLSAARDLGPARVKVTSEGVVGLNELVNFSPTGVVAQSFTAANAAPLEVEVIDPHGKILMKHKEGVFDAMRADGVPTAAAELPECANAQVCLQRAELEERRGDLPMARWINEEGRQRFPNDEGFDRNLGRVEILQAHFQEAQTRFARMAKGKPALDGESEYNWGVALRAAGDDGAAFRHFQNALSSKAFEAAARLEMAMIEGSHKHWKEGLGWLKPADAEAQRQTAMGEVEVTLLRLSGGSGEVYQRLAAWRVVDPTSLFFRYEATLAGRKDAALWVHLGAEPDRVLRIVETYFRMGDYADALPLLSRQYETVPDNQREPGTLPPQKNPLIAYYRGYAKQKLGQDPTPDFEAASKLPTRYVFPSRASSLPVLEAAVKANPNDGTARYLLGNLHLNFFFVDEAIDDYRAALDAGERDPMLYRNLTLTLGKVKTDVPGALSVVAKAETQGALTIEMADYKSTLLRSSAVGVSTEGMSGRWAAATAEPIAPQLANATPDDLAKIAFDRLGIGDLESATTALFAPQAANVSSNERLHKAFYELRLQRVISTARARNCTAVDDQLVRLSDPDPKLPYTQPSGNDYLETPRALFYIGRTYGLCSNPTEALARWRRTASKKVDPASAEAVFPVLARIQLAAYDGKPAVPMLHQALQEAQDRLKAASPDAKPAAQYQVGILLQALGKLSDSDDHLEQVAVGTGPVHYWAAVGMRDNDLGRQGIK